MTSTVRRVVTGLDEAGRSTVLFDDRAGNGAGSNRLLWRSETVPADNSARSDIAAGGFTADMLKAPGSNFLLVEFQPGDNPSGPGMHTTNTLDYIVVLRGRLELRLETGAVQLEAGDIVVDRGVQHDWRALDGASALIAFISLPAAPLGAGGTL